MSDFGVKTTKTIPQLGSVDYWCFPLFCLLLQAQQKAQWHARKHLNHKMSALMCSSWVRVWVCWFSLPKNHHNQRLISLISCCSRAEAVVKIEISCCRVWLQRNPAGSWLLEGKQILNVQFCFYTWFPTGILATFAWYLLSILSTFGPRYILLREKQQSHKTAGWEHIMSCPF